MPTSHIIPTFVLLLMALWASPQSSASTVLDTTLMPQYSAAQSSTSVEYRRLIDLLYSHIAAHRTQEAISCISQALTLEPQNPANALLLGNMAILEQQRGRVDVALLTFEAALSQEPSHARIREARAQLLLEQGRAEEALSDYSYLVQMYPNNEVYLYKRAMLFVERKRYASAEVDLEAIITMNESSLKARQGLALVYTLTKRYTEAERLYDFLIDKAPSHYSIYQDRAYMFLVAGKPGYALRDINKAFDLAGAQPTASLYRLRSDIASAIGDKQGARRDALKAAQLPPSDRQAPPASTPKLHTL